MYFSNLLVLRHKIVKKLSKATYSIWFSNFVFLFKRRLQVMRAAPGGQQTEPVNCTSIPRIMQCSQWGISGEPVIQLYSCTVFQLCSNICTVVQLYSCTVVQLYCCTVVQLYSCTVVQLYSCTVLQFYSCAVLQLYS